MMAALAAAALTSCSESELIDVSDSKAIGFETYIGKATTKGTPVNGQKFTNGATIKVWGFYSDAQMTTDYATAAIPVPNLEGATITLEDGNWKYSPQAYWKDQKAHTFFACAPAAADPTLTNGVFEYTVKEKVAEQVDFMVAEALKNSVWDESVTANPAKQVFAFRHALSQIKFSVGLTEVAADDASDVKIKSVKIEPLKKDDDNLTVGFYTTGKLNVVGRTAGAGVWAWTDLATTYTGGYLVESAAGVDLPNTVAANTSEYKPVYDGTDGVLMLLPQTTEGNVRFTVTLTYKALKEAGAPTKEASVMINTASAQTWDVNKIYHYKLGVSMPKALDQKAIEFTDENMTIEPWDTTETETTFEMPKSNA